MILRTTQPLAADHIIPVLQAFRMQKLQDHEVSTQILKEDLRRQTNGRQGLRQCMKLCE